MNKPKLRFKEFNDEWSNSTIGNVSKDSLSYGMNAPATIYDGINKYIRITDIDEENNTYLNNDIVSPLGELDKKYLVTENDILFARTGASTGKTYLYKKSDGVLYYAGFLIKAHIKDDTCASFVFYNTKLDRYKKWVAITSLRSGQPGINAQEYSNYRIMLPSIEEQKKIAEFLSTVDEVIAEREEEVKDLEQQKKGLMQKIFSQQLRFTDSNNNPYPDWEHLVIGDIYSERSERGCPDRELLSVTMNEGVKKRSEIEGKDNSSEDKSNYKAVFVGDMVYNSMRMWQGANGISSYDGIVSPAYTVMTPKRSICNDFIKYYFKYQPLVFLFRRFSQGLTSDTWNLKYPQIKSLPISLPCLEEQQEIANVLSKLDELIEEKKALLSDWQSFKKGLLQQMFV